MELDDLFRKSKSGEVLTHEELVFLLAFPPDSLESHRLMDCARAISQAVCGNRAEVHAQLALDLAPCACDCGFCSFARSNGVFKKATRIPVDEAVRYAAQFEAAGANAVYVMSTAGYPFGEFIEVSQEIRRNLKPETVLVANVGDQPPENARRLKDSGFSGVYHALRLREGIDSHLSPGQRERSIRNFQEAGLRVGTCVEPVGPEHTHEEIAALIAFTASFRPWYSGAARRIAIPGTAMARRGMISELRMAQVVAVTRLGVPQSVLGNCAHEPCAVGGLAGANLFWAEVGANPRDTLERTEEGRGETVGSCRRIFREAGWQTRNGPSGF